MQMNEQRSTLVLLAGLLCDHEIWQSVADLLAGMADIQIFSFPMFSSIEVMADHVMASVSGRFALAGHSMGGRVALEIVRRTPPRITGVALLNTGVHAPGTQEPETRGRLVSVARESGMAQLARQWLPPMMARSGQSRGDLLTRLTTMVERQSADSFAAQTHALLNRPNAAGILPNIRVPVVFVSADQDTWSPPQQHEAMRQLCPGAELIVVKDAGHMAPVEQPEAVAAVLRAWLWRVVEREKSIMQLNDQEKLQITNKCTQQIYRLARLNDASAFEAVSELFTEDGVLIRPSDPDRPIHGRPAILAALASRPARPTRHVLSNVEVVIESDIRVVVVSTVVMYSGTPPETPGTITSIAIGSYTDVLCPVGDKWLIKERRGKIDMKGTI